jgi:hypothetical protein
MRTRILATQLLLALPILATASAEPAGKATLRLVIVDQTNAVLSHAAVTIYTADGNASVRAVADESGVVYLSAIATGPTQIVASYPGFSPSLEKTMIKAGYNASAVKLLVAPVVEKVTVVAPRTRRDFANP